MGMKFGELIDLSGVIKFFESCPGKGQIVALQAKRLNHTVVIPCCIEAFLLHK
jgi:hypothetical protein